MTRNIVAALALLLSACGGDEAPAMKAAEIPAWAKVAPEQIAEAKKHGVPVAFENDLGMRFVLIPAGTFLMGSPDTEDGHVEVEAAQHPVSIEPFYLSVTEATAGQVKPFDPEETEYYSDKAAFGSATHDSAVAYAAWLSRRADPRTYRLPSEAEWEYACRAGTTSAYAFGDTLSAKQAAVQEDSPKYTGGSYAPNGWGLCDMHGGVWEICMDSWHPSYRGAPDDGQAWIEVDGWEIVMRGGSIEESAAFARSAVRWRHPRGPNVNGEHIGFRLVSPLPERRK